MNNNNIDFTDYNRITDVLMWFDDKYTFNFTVSLSKKNMKGERQFYQFETEYGSQYGGAPLRSIKRNMSFYFTIDNKEVFTAGMIFRPQDVEILMMIINRDILPWFFDPKSKAFHIVKNKLTLGEFGEVYYLQSDNKFIKFEPVVYSYEDGTFTHGIKFIFPNGDCITMNLDKFMGFVHLLKTDMYATACSMLTYVKQEPYGVNSLKMVGMGAGRPPKDNWSSENNNYKGMGANSFLNNSKSKGGK